MPSIQNLHRRPSAAATSSHAHSHSNSITKSLPLPMLNRRGTVGALTSQTTDAGPLSGHGGSSAAAIGRRPSVAQAFKGFLGSLVNEDTSESAPLTHHVPDNVARSASTHHRLAPANRSNGITAPRELTPAELVNTSSLAVHEAASALETMNLSFSQRSLKASLGTGTAGHGDDLGQKSDKEREEMLKDLEGLRKAAKRLYEAFWGTNEWLLASSAGGGLAPGRSTGPERARKESPITQGQQQQVEESGGDGLTAGLPEAQYSSESQTHPENSAPTTAAPWDAPIRIQPRLSVSKGHDLTHPSNLKRVSMFPDYALMRRLEVASPVEEPSAQDAQEVREVLQGLLEEMEGHGGRRPRGDDRSQSPHGSRKSGRSTHGKAGASENDSGHTSAASTPSLPPLHQRPSLRHLREQSTLSSSASRQVRVPTSHSSSSSASSAADDDDGDKARAEPASDCRIPPAPAFPPALADPEQSLRDSHYRSKSISFERTLPIAARGPIIATSQQSGPPAWAGRDQKQGHVGYRQRMASISAAVPPPLASQLGLSGMDPPPSLPYNREVQGPETHGKVHVNEETLRRQESSTDFSAQTGPTTPHRPPRHQARPQVSAQWHSEDSEDSTCATEATDPRSVPSQHSQEKMLPMPPHPLPQAPGWGQWGGPGKHDDLSPTAVSGFPSREVRPGVATTHADADADADVDDSGINADADPYTQSEASFRAHGHGHGQVLPPPQQQILSFFEAIRRPSLVPLESGQEPGCPSEQHQDHKGDPQRESNLRRPSTFSLSGANRRRRPSTIVAGTICDVVEDEASPVWSVEFGAEDKEVGSRKAAPSVTMAHGVISEEEEEEEGQQEEEVCFRMDPFGSTGPAHALVTPRQQDMRGNGFLKAEERRGSDDTESSTGTGGTGTTRSTTTTTTTTTTRSSSQDTCPTALSSSCRSAWEVSKEQQEERGGTGKTTNRRPSGTTKPLYPTSRYTASSMQHHPLKKTTSASDLYSQTELSFQPQSHSRSRKGSISMSTMSTSSSRQGDAASQWSASQAPREEGRLPGHFHPVPAPQQQQHQRQPSYSYSHSQEPMRLPRGHRANDDDDDDVEQHHRWEDHRIVEEVDEWDDDGPSAI